MKYGNLLIRSTSKRSKDAFRRLQIFALPEKTSSARFTFARSRNDLIKACEHILTLAKGNNGFPISIIGTVSSEEREKIKMLLREFCNAAKDIVMSSKGTEHFIAMSMVFAMLESELSA